MLAVENADKTENLPSMEQSPEDGENSSEPEEDSDEEVAAQEETQAENEALPGAEEDFVSDAEVSIPDTEELTVEEPSVEIDGYDSESAELLAETFTYPFLRRWKARLPTRLL